jgi:hypothetical protein
MRLPASLTVGGFNVKRGGLESLQGTSETNLKKALAEAFHGAKFHFTNALTARFLSKIDVFVAGVAYADTTEIAPLTSKEQASLLAFVKGGGSILIFADNDNQFQPASNSLVGPFGLHATGSLNGPEVADFLNSPNPIMQGPFGTAAEIDTNYPGWFDQLGAATELATLAANGMPALAYFPAGGFSSGSGAAVFFSDSDVMIDGERTTNDQIAILNALALAP